MLLLIDIQFLSFIICSPLRVFHTSDSWWFLTGVWVTSFLKSPGLFSVFWPISIMQQFGWSPLVLLFLSPPVLVLTIGIIVTFMLHSFFNSLAESRKSVKREITYLSFHILLISLCGPPGQKGRRSCKFFLGGGLLIIIRSGRLAEIWWSVCISKSQRRLCVSFSRTDSGLYI